MTGRRRAHSPRAWIAASCLAAWLLGASNQNEGIRRAPEITRSGEADPANPVSVFAGRKIYCAIDLGIKNAKLEVISIEAGQPLSFAEERLCKAPLGFGAKVFDPKTKIRSPLAAADIANLVTVVQEFEQICAVDKGTLVGTEASQWARDATNIAEVEAAVRAGAGAEVEVLTPEEEGRYGYAAATRDTPGRLSLDPGSNSFQLGWWEGDADMPRTVSVPFGFVRAAATHYPVTTSSTFDTARAEHAAELIELLDEALAALTPPASFASLRKAIADRKLEPAIFLLGQDGALHLAVRARLRGVDGRWIDTKDAYEKQVEQEKPIAHPTFGLVTTLLAPAEIDGFFANVVRAGDFEALRQTPVRELYGEKALVNTVLLDTLVEQLGITTVILVPQEMPAGFIVARIPKR